VVLNNWAKKSSIPFNELLTLLQNPYNRRDFDKYQIPSDLDKGYKTFCGT